MSANDLKDVHYDAFISYRHNEFDSFVASNLHKKLESFRLPKSVLSKVKSGKTKIERVFRDVDELPLSDNLSDPISKALLNSDFLITICTPRYPQSRWCMKEIEVFLQTHPRNHILVVLAEDEPVNSFPEVLCYDEVEVKDENGNVTITKKEIEPLAADTRGENKKEILKAIDGAVIKLCAAIFGLNYDDLKQRHREQKIRKMITIFGSIGAAVLAFAIFATVMLVKISRQNVIISNQYNELQDRFAASMASASGYLLGDGKNKDAAYAVKSVMPAGGEGRYNPEALKALYKSMDIYKVSSNYSPVCTYEGDAWLDHYEVSFDKKYIFVYDRNIVNIYDVASGDLIRRIDDLGGYGSVSFCGSEGVLACVDDKAYYYPVSGGERTELDIPSDISYYASEYGKVTVGYSEGIVYGISGSGDVIFSTDVSSYLKGDDSAIAEVTFDIDSAVLSFWDWDGEGQGYDILILDADEGTVTGSYHAKNGDSSLRAGLFDGTLYTAVTRDSLTTEVTAVEPGSEKEIWQCRVDDLASAETRLYITDRFIYLTGTITGSYQMVIIDRENGEIIGRNSYSEAIISGCIDGSGLYFLLNNGSVYYCDDLEPNELESEYFTVKPEQRIVWADWFEGDIFCMFDSADYITRYSNEQSPYAEAVDEDREPGEVSSDFAEDDLTGREEFGVDPLLLETAFYSADRKYIYAIFSDHTARIYDAQTAECVTMFEKADEMFSELRYSEVTGSYILTGEKSYILDRDMNVVCIMDAIVCDEGDGFILQNDDLLQFKVPYFDVKKLCEIADEYLKGYTPKDSVKQKYGLL